MAEQIKFSVLDTTFSLDTIWLYDLGCYSADDTIVNDTIINLVRDGRSIVIDSLGFSLIKEYRMGTELPQEIYSNDELNYPMWAISKTSKRDTLFYNRILDVSSSQLENQLCRKKWMASGTDAENFYSIRPNAVSKFQTDFSSRLELSFSQPNSGNRITVSKLGDHLRTAFNGTWKLEQDNHLVIELEKMSLDYLILFLDDQQLILKLLSSVGK